VPVLDVDTFYVRYLYVVPGHRNSPGILLRFLEDLVSHAKRTDHLSICFDLPISEQFRKIHALLQERISGWEILRRGGTHYANRYTCRLQDAAAMLGSLIR
jgi:hypothetical protein